MRLIDADEFKEIILTYGKAGYRALPIEKISDLIDSQSTAYDMDKVIDAVRFNCYGLGMDESSTEIIVDDIKSGGIK